MRTSATKKVDKESVTKLFYRKKKFFFCDTAAVRGPHASETSKWQNAPGRAVTVLNLGCRPALARSWKCGGVTACEARSPASCIALSFCHTHVGCRALCVECVGWHAVGWGGWWSQTVRGIWWRIFQLWHHKLSSFRVQIVWTYKHSAGRS